MFKRVLIIHPSACFYTYSVLNENILGKQNSVLYILIASNDYNIQESVVNFDLREECPLDAYSEPRQTSKMECFKHLRCAVTLLAIT